MISKKHPAYQYCKDVMQSKFTAPIYVIKQCNKFINIADDRDRDFIIDDRKVEMIDKLLNLFIMPKGLNAGKTVKECLAGFQWLLIIAVLCTVYRDNPKKRRYESAIFEIARKNGKTFIVGVLFLLLLFIEPKYSQFFSVAPDGALSREVQKAIKEIIASSPALCGTYQGKLKFKVMRDAIKCQISDSEYVPLNYSNSRLDGRLANVFLVDEAGALPNPYAIEAMRSGQLTILNKLGFVISTKYPSIQNPFEDEVAYAKKVINGSVDDSTVFSLLYEPDATKGWETNDKILEQANPLALVVPEIMEDLKHKRQQAIEMQSKRENFVCKHCNIIYQGAGTESFVSMDDLFQCRAAKPIDWHDREVYVGVDLSMSNDNCAVAMAAFDEASQKVIAEVMAFIPEGKIEEKNANEKLNYNDYIKANQCVACGDRTVDYAVIEKWVLELEQRFGVKVNSIGYDRYNAISSAQKWEEAGLQTVEIRQHSSLLHAPTKWLSECIEEGNFLYDSNKLLEINFSNARCTYDTNLNRYVTKKKSNGKVDMVVALINAMYLCQQNAILHNTLDWAVQF